MLHQGDMSGKGSAALVHMGSLEAATRAVEALHGRSVPNSTAPLIVRCGRGGVAAVRWGLAWVVQGA